MNYRNIKAQKANFVKKISWDWKTVQCICFVEDYMRLALRNVALPSSSHNLFEFTARTSLRFLSTINIRRLLVSCVHFRACPSRICLLFNLLL